MKRKFKTKKHIKITPVIIIMFIIFIFIITLKYISKNTPKKEIDQLLNKTNNYEKIHQKEMVSMITGIKINKPTTILENTTNYEKEEIIKFNLIHNESKRIENKSQIEQSEPLVYIYNTHQTEEYVGNGITPQPTVLTGAYYLKDLLEKEGIKTIVEETNIKEILNNNNWNYTESYKASKINLEKIKMKYPSIKIFIDFHRDAVSRNISTTTINEKSCAKVLFVIGKEHQNYEKNLEFTTKLNNIISNNYQTLTKGILQKEGFGVNGIYNQDVGENVILMEVGGNENTIEEVTNTLELIAPLIKEDINGQ